MRNSSLLSQFLEPNAARTKFDVSKCRIAPPSPHPKQNPDYFLKLLPPKFIKLEQKMFFFSSILRVYITQGTYVPFILLL